MKCQIEWLAFALLLVLFTQSADLYAQTSSEPTTAAPALRVATPEHTAAAPVYSAVAPEPTTAAPALRAATPEHTAAAPALRAAPPVSATVTPLPEFVSSFLPRQVTGYVQADYVISAESRDQLNDGNQLGGGAVLNAQGQLGGAAGQSSDANALTLNQNRFFLRRARIRVADEYKRGAFAADYTLQVDANTIAGPSLGLRDAEIGVSWLSDDGPSPSEARVAGQAREAADTGTALTTVATAGVRPSARSRALRIRLGAGMFRSPFGYETYELSHQARLFSEPALLANAFFPGDYDLGVRLQADFREMFLVAALQNGEPIGARGFPGRDANSAKDWFIRLGGRSQLAPRIELDGALSFTRGQGFHPGTPPTKDTLVWRDFSEDGIAQPAEIQVIRGASATASENFLRWGIGMDVRVRATIPRIGLLTVFGEAATAVNLDRGLRPADPIVSGAPQRGIGIYAGFVQEIGALFSVGFRADHYNARLDGSETQGGTLVRVSQPFTQYAFAGAFRFLEHDTRRGRGRIMVEYAVRRDLLGRDGAGIPADLSDNRLTLRLQFEL